MEDLIFTICNEMRDKCSQLFIGNYIHLGKCFICLCFNSPGRYSFNILRIVTIFYHFYIEYEIYKLAYNIVKSILNDSIFIKVTMVKWDENVTFLKIIRSRGY